MTSHLRLGNLLRLQWEWYATIYQNHIEWWPRKQWKFLKDGMNGLDDVGRVCLFCGCGSTGEIGAVESRRREEISMLWLELWRVMAGVVDMDVDLRKERRR
jgi:hypothetical protein